MLLAAPFWACCSSLLLLLLLFVGLVVAEGQGLCDKCFCDKSKSMVYCRPNSLDRIPEDVPKFVRVLRLNDNHLNGKITATNLSHMGDVEGLYMANCGIEEIEPGAFSGLAKLKQLDLSSNRIKRLEDRTFSGLRLHDLVLSGNLGLTISFGAFANMTTERVQLDECGITKMDSLRFAYEYYSSGLQTAKSLQIANNQIRKVEERHFSMLQSFETVYLAANPLHCNCDIKKFYAFFASNRRRFLAFDWDAPHCSSPLPLKGKSFQNLTARDFQCEPPSVKSGQVLFDRNDSALLKCVATGDPLPTLFWNKPNQEAFQYSPDALPESAGEIEATFRIQRTADSTTLENFTCAANNSAGNASLVLQVSWPQRSLPQYSVAPCSLYGQSDTSGSSKMVRDTDDQKSVAGDRKPGIVMIRHGNNGQDEPIDNGVFAEELRFTLTDMISAVVGTFLSSLFVFSLTMFLVQKCAQYRKRKRRSGSQGSQSTSAAYGGGHLRYYTSADELEYFDTRTGYTTKTDVYRSTLR